MRRTSAHGIPSRRKAACVSTAMNRVAVTAGDARGAPAKRSARHPEGQRCGLKMAGSGLMKYGVFPVVCLMPPTELSFPFVGDDAGGNSFFGPACVFTAREGSVLSLGHKPKPRRAASSTHHLP